MAKNDDKPDLEGGDNSHRAAAGELRSFLERAERLEEEKKTIGDDLKDVFAEAKGRGYDTKALKALLKERKLDKNKKSEERAIVNLYSQALGMGDIFA